MATLESLAGLLTFGLAAGIMFARFARPNARIIFSRNALIAPYLSLERQKVAIFPLAWTIVHPIGESSPLWGQTAEDLEQCEAEFLVLLTGFDETFSQTVHARSSYRVHEVRFGARFGDMFDRDADDGVLKVDLARIHDAEKASL